MDLEVDRAEQRRLAVERFAPTTNDITYAVAGDMLDYWGFFPTEAGRGRPGGRFEERRVDPETAAARDLTKG